MKQPLRVFLFALVAVAISLPLGVVLTIVLFPFWSWFEATTGIESVGHSGPAEWCYLVMLTLVFSVTTVLLLSRAQSKQNAP
jgi:hypothetical protein